ncbi:MAG: hypothetical protein ACP5IT_04090 [Thermoproteota archaeon]
MNKIRLGLAVTAFLAVAIILFMAYINFKKEMLGTTTMRNATGYLWNFSQDNTLKGWVMAHSLSQATITNYGLTTKVNGFDPYMYSPTISVVAERQRKVIVACRVLGNATALKLYWISSESPNWSEDKSLEVPIVSDGLLHEYVFDLTQSSAWKGTITQIRLDPEPAECYGTELSILYVKIPILGPELGLEGPYLSTPIPTVNKEFNVSVHLLNTGGEKLNLAIEVEVPEGLRIVKGNKVTLSELDINKGENISWTLVGSESAIYNFKINITSSSEKLYTTFIFSFPVYPKINLEDLLSKAKLAEDNKVTQVEDGSFILKSGNEIIYFVKSKIGYGPIVILLKDKEDLKPLGVFGVFASLITEKNRIREKFFVVPKNVTLGKELIEFNQVNEKWNFTSRWLVANSSITVENNLKALNNLNVSQFSVSLYPGELSFGSLKNEALFPGLEWLVNNEVSSSTLDVASPFSLRTVPNPIKVTIPLMAIRYNSSLVALLWNPYFSWDGTHRQLQPQFASPNWVENQNNHLLSLFVPTVPEWVKENYNEAYLAYKLRQGKQLSISFIVYATNSDTVLDAVKEWIRVFGLPNPVLPRSFSEELNLSMQAYLSSLWTPKKGWSHASGWNPEPFPGYALLLLLTSFQEKDPTLKNELMLRFNESLSLALKNGPAYLASSSGLHIPGWQLPFYVGYLEEGLFSIKNYVYSLISTQDLEGEWSFQPSESTTDLGATGAKELGTTAIPAAEVLRYARITGDKHALDSGLKALEAMKKYRIPRAAQTWEIPIHTPDILASARAIDAYLEGYIATGNKEYLERAKYWAYAGLPFVYLWSKEDRTIMLYATIPVYGATHYKAPVWIGRPVQWCGLVYAYELLRLSKYDNSFPWKLIGEGILSSGMRQQITSGSLVGTFPDSWDLISNVAYGPYINPEDLVKPTLVLIGFDPDLNTVVLRTQRGNITVTTPSKILESKANNTQVELRLSFFKNESCYVLISGFRANSVLKLNIGKLSYAENLNNITEGFKTLSNTTIIKVRFSNEELELILFGSLTP